MIYDVSTVKGWAKGVEKHGNTLFKDGSPYTACGICELPIKVVDCFTGVKHIKVSNGRKQATIEPLMVLVGHWLHLPDETTFDVKLGVFVCKKVSKPILHSVQACFDCWNRQQDMRAAKNREMNDGRNDHLVFYDDRKLAKPTRKALISTAGNAYKIKPTVYVNTTTAPTTNNTQEALMLELVRDYLPIITWHVPLVEVISSYDAIEKAFTTVGHIADNILGINRTGLPRLWLTC